MRVAITGASGLIGSALARDLSADGVEVIRLVRRDPRTAGEVRWDPPAAAAAPPESTLPAVVPPALDPAALSGVDAVVHLAGAPIAPRRWTPARKALLRASRIASTSGLVAAMTAAESGPAALLSGSAIGYYGDTADRVTTEGDPAGTGFLADLVRDWEAAAEPASTAGIRVVNLRTGVVLAPGGGMLASLALPFKLGLGARLGSGRQYLSWISLTDEVRAIRFLLAEAGASGPFNVTAPQPVTNKAFTRALAAALHRPALLALPAPALRLALGEVAGDLLGSARIIPARLTGAGFTFTHPDIALALADLA